MTLVTVASAILLQAITFANVAGGLSSQIDEPRRVVVRSADEFQALWKSHSTAVAPKVDFSKHVVVGVFLGMRPSAGYAVSIVAVKKADAGAVVEYVETVPDRSKMVAQMLTAPFHLVAIPREIASVEFKQLPR